MCAYFIFLDLINKIKFDDIIFSILLSIPPSQAIPNISLSHCPQAASMNFLPLD
jgi:hypothetical protein